MSTDTVLKVAGLTINVVRKDIKNLHLGVYPPAGRVRVAAPLGPAGVLTAWAIFPVLHASHGAGFASGLLHYLRAPDWGPIETLEARPALRAV